MNWFINYYTLWPTPASNYFPHAFDTIFFPFPWAFKRILAFVLYVVMNGDSGCSRTRSSSVCGLSVGVSVTTVSPAKVAESIVMPFGVMAWVDSRNHL